MNNIWKDLGLEVGKIIADEIKGGPTSGNYGHGGRPGERGGSTSGGGHGKLGIGKGASRDDARAAIDKHREARAQGKQPTFKVKPKMTYWGGRYDYVLDGDGVDELKDKIESDEKYIKLQQEYFDAMKPGVSVEKQNEASININKRVAELSVAAMRNDDVPVPNGAKLSFNQALDIAAMDASKPINISLFRIYGSRNLLSSTRDILVRDANIRNNGREMTAKYPGTDKITGAQINVGDNIIYSSYGTTLK